MKHLYVIMFTDKVGFKVTVQCFVDYGELDSILTKVKDKHPNWVYLAHDKVSQELISRAYRD